MKETIIEYSFKELCTIIAQKNGLSFNSPELSITVSGKDLDSRYRFEFKETSQTNDFTQFGSKS